MSKGFVRRGAKLRVSVYANGYRESTSEFAVGTPLSIINRWRSAKREELRRRHPKASAGSLLKDAERYLSQVKAMPTYAQRRDHINLWIAALGPNLPRQSIGAEQIGAVLQQWRTDGLGPAACNKRRTALMHMWSKLDGKGARNPVRDVPKFRAPDALPRGKDPHVVDAALLKAPLCRSRAACRVLLWTGLRPVELDRAEPDDYNKKLKTLVVRTAKGGRVRVLPLTPQAIAALDEFDAENGWHHVPQAAPLGRWLKKITKLDLRVYDLRHSYGTALALRKTRLDVIGSLLGHSTLELSKRYTLAAVTPDALEATSALARTIARRRAR
jgi:integrase